MEKLAVVISKSSTGDVYIIGEEDVKKFVSAGYKIGGYASTNEEAEKIADKFC
jgi:hypothetical protein